MCPTEREVGKIPTGQVYLAVSLEGRNSYCSVPVALVLFAVTSEQSLLGQVIENINEMDENWVLPFLSLRNVRGGLKYSIIVPWRTHN